MPSVNKAFFRNFTLGFFAVDSILENIKRFIERMLDPGVGTGAVDVYAWMFGCQFIVFLIIASSWSAFSSPEVGALFNSFVSKSSDKVPQKRERFRLKICFLILVSFANSIH